MKIDCEIRIIYVILAPTPLLLGLQNVRSLNAPGRVPLLKSEILSLDLDVLCLTETWQRSDDDFSFHELSVEPMGFFGLGFFGFFWVDQP